MLFPETATMLVASRGAGFFAKMTRRTPKWTVQPDFLLQTPFLVGGQD